MLWQYLSKWVGTDETERWYNWPVCMPLMSAKYITIHDEVVSGMDTKKGKAAICIWECLLSCAIVY